MNDDEAYFTGYSHSRDLKEHSNEWHHILALKKSNTEVNSSDVRINLKQNSDLSLNDLSYSHTPLANLAFSKKFSNLTPSNFKLSNENDIQMTTRISDLSQMRDNEI